MAAALLKSLVVATILAFPVGILAVVFGERALAKVKAFIEQAGIG